jgi:sulfate/thiosulfate transport system substrate-binding protein
MRPSTLLALIATAFLAMAPLTASAQELLNVSYDPTRELWKALNAAWGPKWAAQNGGAEPTVRMSHGGSGSQARSVVDGLEADVVTLAMWPDTNAIAKSGLMDLGWEKALPNNSTAYTSTIVFVVRKGNPKGIKDWPDIIKPGVEVITPNPKTSGNGKLSFLALWGYIKLHGGSDKEAMDAVTKLYQQVPVLDIGARGSTVTFVQKKIGDVHLTWENEAHLEVEEAKGQVEIVYPSASFNAEPPLAVVTKNAERKGTTAAAKNYLEFLYTPEGQEIIAKHFYRPTDQAILQKYRSVFPEMTLFDVTKTASNWDDAYDKYFGDGKLFDQIYKPKK